MKSTVATFAGLFATGALAIPSLHNAQHEHLHRRQGYGSGADVSYVTEVVTNTAVQYVDANGHAMSGPAPTSAAAAAASSEAPAQAQGPGAGYGQQGANGPFSTMVTAANGQQVSAQAWGWGSPNGPHGYSWQYSQPAGGYPTKGPGGKRPHSSGAAPSASTPAQQQYTPPAKSQVTPSSQAAPSQQPAASSQEYKPAPSQQPSKAPASSPASSPAASPSGSPAKSSSASAPVNSGSTQWQQTVVSTHNIHRANHSVPDIAWSDSLAQAAQMVANKCSFTHDLSTGKDICGFQSYGQNFACTSGSDNIGQDITTEWYNEEGIYELSGSYGQANPNNYGDSETGHFTQLVWKASTHVGCAIAQCPNGVAGTSGMKELTVCDYGPEGNMGGEYAQNVPRPKGMPSTKGSEAPAGYSS